MAKSELDKVTEEKLARGGVLVKLYFDMQHKDREQLQPLMANLINEHLLKEKGVVYCYGAIEEPIEHDGVYSTSAILTVLFEGFMPIVDVAFKYAPAGIEIMEPTKGISFKTGELQNLLMDMSQLSVEYSKFILQRVMTPEEKEEMSRALEGRAAAGKKFLDSKESGEKAEEGKR